MNVMIYITWTIDDIYCVVCFYSVLVIIKLKNSLGCSKAPCRFGYYNLKSFFTFNFDFNAFHFLFILDFFFLAKDGLVPVY